MQPRSVAATAVINVSLSFVLLVAGVGGGAAFGLLNGPSAAAASVPDSVNHIAAFTAAEQVHIADLNVEEAPVARTVVRKVVRHVVAKPAAGKGTARGAGPANASAGLPGSAIAGTENCARLDDKKIQWLLRLLAKAKASNPDQAAVAAGVEQQLNAALGKNMCAEEAQIYLGNMCADPAVKRFMGLMVKELPFFVRPLVGDPCTKDLVAAADKYLP